MKISTRKKLLLLGSLLLTGVLLFIFFMFPIIEGKDTLYLAYDLFLDIEWKDLVNGILKFDKPIYVAITSYSIVALASISTLLLLMNAIWMP